MAIKRIRRDRSHWQQLVERQAISGQNSTEFCRQQDIPYASFMGWRKRIQQHTDPNVAPPGTFVELTAPAQNPSALSAPQLDESTLCVELSLGGGIELRISRGG